jgi:hypothetical protein
MSVTAIVRKWRDPTFVTATIGAGLCLLLLAVILRGRSRTAPAGDRHHASSFFTDAAGTRAILLVLRRLVPAAEQWRRPLTQLPAPTLPEAPTTLLVFAPPQPLSVDQAEALERWMAQGGQVVLASRRDWPLRRAHNQEVAAASAPSRAPASEHDGFLSSHGMRLVRRASRPQAPGTSLPLSLEPYAVRWEKPSPAYRALVRDGPQVLVGSKRIGAGRLVVVPDAGAFVNQRLRQTENAVWLVRLCATWGNGRVLIDEFHHGFGARRGLLALIGLFLGTPWGWACLHGAAAGLLYLFGPLQRFGRPYDPPAPQRNSPIDRIDARGSLLAASEARTLAVDLVHRHLQYRLGKPFGLPVNVADPDLYTSLRTKRPDLGGILDRYNALVQRGRRGETLSDREFVDLGKLASQLSKEYTAL